AAREEDGEGRVGGERPRAVAEFARLAGLEHLHDDGGAVAPVEIVEPPPGPARRGCGAGVREPERPRELVAQRGVLRVGRVEVQVAAEDERAAGGGGPEGSPRARAAGARPASRCVFTKWSSSPPGSSSRACWKPFVARQSFAPPSQPAHAAY